MREMKESLWLGALKVKSQGEMGGWGNVTQQISMGRCISHIETECQSITVDLVPTKFHNFW